MTAFDMALPFLFVRLETQVDTEARKIIGNLIPRRFRIREHVPRGSSTRIRIHSPEGNDQGVGILETLDGELRAAAAAEDFAPLRRRSEFRQEIAAGNPLLNLADGTTALAEKAVPWALRHIEQ